MARNVAVAGAIIAGSLGIGTCGYRWIAGLDWVDSLLNASMILAGEGPVDPMRTTAAKLFASAYAMFSGVVFISSVAFLLAPLAHRLLHRFHMEAEGDRGGGGKRRHPRGSGPAPAAPPPPPAPPG